MATGISATRPSLSRTRFRAVRVFFAAAVAATGIVGFADESEAATRDVAIKDNFYSPKKLHIEPGDTVVWTNQGTRTHTVTSDDKDFRSGEMKSGQSFSYEFQKEGYYFYHCNFHGAKGRVGQWGVVIVGDPPKPPELEGPGDDLRDRLVVPRDYNTIQKAVDHAAPGTTVVIAPGVYREDVVVRKTRNLVIRGVDRFRTIINGDDRKFNGITVDASRNIKVANLTVRNFLSNGVYFNNSRGYMVNRVDAIKNRTYGVYAYESYDGVFKNSFGWGSGDSAFYIGGCLGCSGLIQNVHAEKNYIGYSGTNATGVIIRNSTWVHNGAGIVPNTLPNEPFGPNRGTLMYDNVVRRNNYTSVPAAGISDTVGIPFGTGIWMPGVQNNVAKNNVIAHHRRYGVLIGQSIHEDAFPMNNRVRRNRIRDSGMYDLAWDGTGADNCFSKNNIKGETSHPEMQNLYACSNRPFVGAPQPIVQADVAASLTAVATREQEEPPEPNRPRCQRGRPGCNR